MSLYAKVKDNSHMSQSNKMNPNYAVNFKKTLNSLSYRYTYKLGLYYVNFFRIFHMVIDIFTHRDAPK